MRYSILSILLLTNALFVGCAQQNTSSVSTAFTIPEAYHEEGSWKKAGIKEGFIITYVDKVPVDNVEDLNRILEIKKGGVLVEGVYKTGEKGTYGVDW